MSLYFLSYFSRRSSSRQNQSLNSSLIFSCISRASIVASRSTSFEWVPGTYTVTCLKLSVRSKIAAAFIFSVPNTELQYAFHLHLLCPVTRYSIVPGISLIPTYFVISLRIQRYVFRSTGAIWKVSNMNSA